MSYSFKKSLLLDTVLLGAPLVDNGLDSGLRANTTIFERVGIFIISSEDMNIPPLFKN